MPNNFPPNFFNGSLPIALVAGGAGFIGSHVCHALLEKNIKVICLDNWQSGLKKNIKGLLENKNFILLERDIAKHLPKEIERLDYVLQLAGIESYLSGEGVSIETLEANSVGTKNLLDLSVKHNARFLLASTIYVYSGRVSLNGKLSHNEAKRFAEALTGEYGQQKNLDVRVVRIGDVYGPKMVLGTNSLISRVFKQATYNEQIVLPGQGAAKIFPIFVDDVVSGIVKVLFSSGLKNSVVSLIDEKYNLLDVARTVKEIGAITSEIAIDPRDNVVDIEESVEKNIEKEKLEQEGRVSWQPKVDLREGVGKTLQWLYANIQQAVKEEIKQQNIERENFWQLPDKSEIKKAIEEPKKQTFFNDLRSNKNKTKKNGYWVMAIFVGVLFWFFFLPFIQFGVGLFELTSAKNSINKSDLQNAKTWSVGAGQWFGASSDGFSRWSNIPGIKNEGSKFSNKSNQFKELAQISNDTANILTSAKILFSGIGGSSTFDSTKNSKDLSLQLKSLENEVGFLQAEIGDREISIAIPFGKKLVVVYEGDLSIMRKASSGLAGLIENLPELTGQKEKKTYLVLFQDSSELTATGGIISAYGLLNFEKGHLVNFQIQDSQVADSALKGHVDPPSQLKQFAQINDWNLKMANWDPDFPTTASRTAWFIDHELGQKVNGVVAVDTTFIKNVVKQMGTLEIAGSSDKISENAIDGKILQARDKNSNYTEVLARSLMMTLNKNPEKSLGAFSRAIVDSLYGRHILVWTDNNNANNALLRAGWEGSVKKISCTESSNQTQNCITDYVQMVEENVGQNSANFFIQRSYSLELTVEKDKITHRLTLSYKNNAGQGGKADYKNYFRLYTSLGSDLSLGSTIDAESGKQEQLQIEKSQLNGKTIFGTYVVVPSKSTKDLVFIWETPNAKQIESGGSLVFFWQKQAGIGSDPVNLRINLPNDQAYKNSVYPVPSLTGDSFIGYNTFLSHDLLTNITWQPK